jgi:hypothetical protein
VKFRDDYRTSWKFEPRTHEKSWGHEIHIASLDSVQTKVLFMRKGYSNSLKYYESKNETLFVRRGKIRVIHGCEYTVRFPEEFPYDESVLDEGQGINIQSGCPYQIFALEDSEILEMSDKADSGKIIIDHSK